MVVTDCFVVTGDGHRRSAIAATVVPIIRFGICVVGVWVEACPSEADCCVPSSDNIDLSGLVSFLQNSAGAFPVIASI